MKKMMMTGVLSILCAVTALAAEPKPYAAAGVFELGGRVEFYGSRYFAGDSESGDSSGLYLNFAPKLDYFIVNGLHVGFAPDILLFSDIDDISNAGTAVYLVPTASLGYSFRLAEMLFLDVEGSYGFGVSVYDNYFGENDIDTDLYMNFGATVGFKVPVNSAVFSFGVRQNFQYATWHAKDYDDVYQAGIVFGVSAYL
ncbi:MAG TPA: hypothetical protein PK926_12410 [Spirochaetota bacterium]|nr:hypothetical protein [Spirochaetota bacterium]HPI88917.1 hypothetical protein [Spirochaetota bacterium]HPR46606.1 hypothetical protein [Spirochaetota bacterium]